PAQGTRSAAHARGPAAGTGDRSRAGNPDRSRRAVFVRHDRQVVILTRFAHFVILSSGWQRALIALMAGALSMLAMAPFNAWPVLFLAVPVAVWLIDGAHVSKLGGWPSAALSGWLFGFGYFLTSLYWIGNAFLVDADIFGWLLPFAVAGLPAGLAIFTAIG